MTTDLRRSIIVGVYVSWRSITNTKTSAQSRTPAPTPRHPSVRWFCLSASSFSWKDAVFCKRIVVCSEFQVLATPCSIPGAIPLPPSSVISARWNSSLASKSSCRFKSSADDAISGFSSSSPGNGKFHLPSRPSENRLESLTTKLLPKHSGCLGGHNTCRNEVVLPICFTLGN